MTTYHAAGELIARCDVLLAFEQAAEPIAAPVRPAPRRVFPGQSLAKRLTDYLRGTGELAADQHLEYRADPTATQWPL